MKALLVRALAIASLAGCRTSQPSAVAAEEPTPAPAPAPAPEAPTRGADAFVEPEPRPFVGGRPSWRQEPWWTLRIWGDLPHVVYKVGRLYGIQPMARPLARPWLHPRPPEEWLARRCKRCAQDANPDGRPPFRGVLTFPDEGEAALTDEVRQRVAADFLQAAGELPPEGELEVDEDGWVWLTHTPEAHLRVMDWLRSRTCTHRHAPTSSAR